MAFTARANRVFLGRAVGYLAAEAGIRQFLGIGTGIPAAGNTHEVAQAAAPECRVVYVDYDPHAIAARIMEAVPPGSYLALSHAGLDLLSPETRQGLEGVADKMMQQAITYRTREQVARFFDGTDLVDPGLVRVEEWRPASATADTQQSSFWCAVARKH